MPRSSHGMTTHLRANSPSGRVVEFADGAGPGPSPRPARVLRASRSSAAAARRPRRTGRQTKV
jgi:hypothetical protein